MVFHLGVTHAVAEDPFLFAMHIPVILNASRAFFFNLYYLFIRGHTGSPAMCEIFLWLQW